MAYKWAEVPLEQLRAQVKSAFAMGPFGSKIKAENFTTAGVPVIKGGNLNSTYLDETSFDFLTNEKANELESAKARRLDIVITHRGTLGQVGLIPEDSRYEEYVVSQSQLKMSFDIEKVDPYFVYYFLKSPLGQSRLLSNVSQVGVPAIAQALTSVRAIEILLPPNRAEQVRISKILRDLDQKIDLNRRINQTLEAMAQAIFKSWFVDFDPVKAKIAAKQEGRDPQRAAMSAISGKPDVELDALPPEQYEQLAATAALFPQEMEESELGEIPKGWRASPFGSLLAHTIGGDWGSDTPDSSNDTRVAIIRGTDIPDLDQAQAHRVPIRYTTQKKLASRMLQVGDLVLEVSGGSKDQPTGRSIRITENTMREFDCPIEPASFCRLLRPISPEISVILGLHLAHIYAQGKTWEYQNQSTGIANFQTAHFLDAELVAIPPAMVAEKFYGLVNPMLERRHDAQNRRLAVLRDTLLPKLLSGELSVEAIAPTSEATP